MHENNWYTANAFSSVNQTDARFVLFYVFVMSVEHFVVMPAFSSADARTPGWVFVVAHIVASPLPGGKPKAIEQTPQSPLPSVWKSAQAWGPDTRDLESQSPTAV